MADVVKYQEEYREIEMLLKDAKGGANSQQTSGNIYSRFQQKEVEVRIVQSKYNECKKIVFELQNRIERLSNQLMESKFQQHAAKQKLQTTEDVSRPVPTVVKPEPSVVKPQLETDDPFVVDSFSQGRPQGPHSKYILASDLVTAVMPSVPVGGQNESKPLDESCISSKEFPVYGDIGKHTISDELFHKVFDQNKRLKQLLQECIDARGLSANDIRDHSQLVLVTQNLTSEIEKAKKEVKELKRTLASSGDELKRENAELLNRVRQLEHTAAVRKTMISHLSDHCRCLHNEVRNLLAGGSLSTEGAAKTIVGIENGQLIQKVLDDVSKLQENYNADRLSKQKVEAKVDNLERSKRELEKKCKQLQEQLDKALEENQKWQERFVGIPAKSPVAPVPARGTAASCGRSIAPVASYLPQCNLVIDSPEPEPEVRVKQWMCSRCDRQFTDRSQYEAHVKKCED